MKVKWKNPVKTRSPISVVTDRAKHRPTRQQPQTIYVMQQPNRSLLRRRGPQPLPVPASDDQDLFERQKTPGGRTLWRVRHQLAPFAVTAALLTAALIVELAVGSGADRAHAAAYTTLTAAIVAAVLVKTGRARLPRWRNRLPAWALGAVLWLAWASTLGLTGVKAATLVLATVACSAAWWQHKRKYHPAGPPDKPTKPNARPAKSDTVGNWYAHIANDKGAAPGSTLIREKTTTHDDQ